MMPSRSRGRVNRADPDFSDSSLLSSDSFPFTRPTPSSSRRITTVQIATDRQDAGHRRQTSISSNSSNEDEEKIRLVGSDLRRAEEADTSLSYTNDGSSGGRRRRRPKTLTMRSVDKTAVRRLPISLLVELFSSSGFSSTPDSKRMRTTTCS